MATILAANTGNWTNPATWTGGVVPGAGDVAVANGKTITVTQSVTCAEVRNDGLGSATQGGYFDLPDGVTLTADVYAGAVSPATALACVYYAGAVSAAVIGNAYGGSVSNSGGIRHAGTGTLTVTGNSLGGSQTNARGVVTASGATGTLILNGNALGGGAGSGVLHGGTGAFIINGTAIGNGYGPGSIGLSIAPGAINNNFGVLLVRATQQGPLGMAAVLGQMQFIDAAHASAKVRATSGLTEVTLRHPASVCPHPNDVLSGINYASNTFVGYATSAKKPIYMSNL